ncbi:MAG: glycosyltransferase family 2 protein [Planctomycetota bacterium]
MLTYVAILFAATLIGAAFVQWGIAVSFAKYFTQLQDAQTDASNASQPIPGAAILMSVRGMDPSLLDAVNGALNQLHENFEVHIVVDHTDDAAWERLNELKKNSPHGERLQLQLMREPRTTCGLKCHCLVQAAESLGDHIQHVALLDADVVPHPQWLSALTRPLSDSTVGGVTGAQWFEPTDSASHPSWWRSTWNGGAMIPTIYFANPWAGSFAMRKEDLIQSGLLDAWKKSIVDDGPIREHLGHLGLKIVFAPSLIMVNREACGHRYVYRWTTRMLTWSRLHETTFYLSQIHAAFSNVVFGGNVLVIVVALFLALRSLGLNSEANYLLPLQISLLALVTAGVLCTSAYRCARSCVEHSCQLRGESLPRASWIALWQVFWASAPAHWLYGISCWRATWKTQVMWRGIRYRIHSKSEIERLNYAPFIQRSRDQSRSI